MAAATTLPAPADPLKNILDILGTFGTGTTTTTSSGAASSQADDLIKSIQDSANPENLATLIQGILLKAKEGLGPNIAATIGSGARATSDSSLALIQGNAQAHAAAEGAQAILEAKNNANKLAVQLADTRLASSRSTRTGISPAGKGLLGLTAINKLKKAGIKNPFASPESTKASTSPVIDPNDPEGFGVSNTSTAVTDVVPSADALSGVQAGDVLGGSELSPLAGIDALTTSDAGLASGISAADAAASADALDLSAAGGIGAAAGVGATAEEGLSLEELITSGALFF